LDAASVIQVVGRIGAEHMPRDPDRLLPSVVDVDGVVADSADVANPLLCMSHRRPSGFLVRGTGTEHDKLHRIIAATACRQMLTDATAGLRRMPQPCFVAINEMEQIVIANFR